MREHDTQTTESTDSNERTDSAPAATVPVRRRTLLRTVGASTAATTLAGCFGSSDNGNGGNGTVEPDEDENSIEDENAIDREFAGAEPCTVGSIPDGDPTTTSLRS